MNQMNMEQKIKLAKCGSFGTRRAKKEQVKRGAKPPEGLDRVLKRSLDD